MNIYPQVMLTNDPGRVSLIERGGTSADNRSKEFNENLREK